MATNNAAQIADWNGPMGQQWARLQRELDAMVMPFGDAALKRAAPGLVDHPLAKIGRASCRERVCLAV